MDFGDMKQLTSDLLDHLGLGCAEASVLCHQVDGTKFIVITYSNAYFKKVHEWNGYPVEYFN